MPLLECIMECGRKRGTVCMCVKCCHNHVNLCKPVSVCQVEKTMSEWSVHYIIQHAFSKTHWGWSHRVSDGEWFLSHHWTEQDVSILLQPNTSIWATLTRGWDCSLLSVFDLQINWPQFTLMRFVSHSLTRFQSQALILAAVSSSCGATGGHCAYPLLLPDTWSWPPNAHYRCHPSFRWSVVPLLGTGTVTHTHNCCNKQTHKKHQTIIWT